LADSQDTWLEHIAHVRAERRAHRDQLTLAMEVEYLQYFQSCTTVGLFFCLIICLFVCCLLVVACLFVVCWLLFVCCSFFSSSSFYFDLNL
jgi:hypothetical protein